MKKSRQVVEAGGKWCWRAIFDKPIGLMAPLFLQKAQIFVDNADRTAIDKGLMCLIRNSRPSMQRARVLESERV